MSVATITAADPDGLQANQGFNVTVESAATNQAPVAVGTIPGSRLQIGGTSTIDVAGYFSDPDGDELSYTGASSNPTVATVSMEGSTATINAVATGDAVITITASDGSASVSQGFRIDVPAGPEEATVVISRLLDANRQQISDPSGIAGTIYAVLDVQSNDETWTEIGLTLNGETVSPLCRGTGGTSADVAVGPGLAAAGQVEIECVLTTNDVLGECVGMQLEPKYANGEYELSAFLTTDAGDRRDVVASQPIELGNPNFVKIAHVPGSASELGNHTKGLTFYGGPAVEGNVNMFHACPVAYDGTVVGSMQLSTVVTDTEQNPVEAPGPTFRTRRGGPAFPVDDEAPFTWSIITDWWSGNHAYWSEGAENVPGETETWIVNSGIITDPNGLDVGSKFRSAGEAKLGPLHFDYRAPNTSSDDSQISISRLSSGAPVYGPTSAAYYYDGTGSNPMRLWISDMTEGGVGHVYGTTSAIAVGDCSVRANADTRGSTAFTALEGYENITHISQLAEEDPVRDAVNDGGGIDCYVAEVQALADRLGNAVDLAEEPRIRTATTFGVDRTPPVISRERPSEALVLNENALSFEIEDPRFESGEDGSQQRAAAYAYAGDSRYWVTSNHYWSSSVDISTGSATVDITPPQTTPTHRFAREEEHTVYIWARDNAGNSAFTSFTFTRDHSPPALALSAVPSSFGLTQAASVSVTVAGTLSDATEIRRAFLSIHHADANGACTEANPLESTQVANPVRRLHNGTNKIEFSEVFTIKKAGDLGATNYCFYLRAEDDARDANGGGDENSYEEVVSTFGVTWPGTAPAPPVATSDVIAAAMLQLGGTTTAEVDVATHFTDANGDPLTYTAASSDDAVATASVTGSMVTVTAVAAGTATITITASDNGTGTATKDWDVTVAAATEYGFVFTDASDMPLTMVAVNEGDSTTYKVALDQAPTADVTVELGVKEANRAVYAQLTPASLTFTSADYMTAQTVKVKTVTHDANTGDEMFTLTHDPSGGEYEDAATAELSGTVNDDEIALSVTGLMNNSISENADTAEVTLTASTSVAHATDDRSFDVTFLGGTAVDADFDVLGADKVAAATVTISIPMGDMSKDTTLYIVPIDDDQIGGATGSGDAETEDIGFAAGAVAYSAGGSAPAGTTVNTEGTEVQLMDDDPDVTLSVNNVNELSIAEDVGSEQMVTVTVMDPAGNMAGVDRTFTVTVTGGAGDVQYTTRGLDGSNQLTVTLGPGATSGTGTFYLTPTNDQATNANRAIAVSAAVSSLIEGTGSPTANKANGVAYTIGGASIELVNDDSS